MSHPSSRSVVISAAVLGLLAGCGGGGDDADARPPQRSVADSTTSTTAAPTAIDLSQPIPGGSLHGTPRPPLENTGDDYVAIFESIDATFRWLGENPDVAVLDELYVPGTQTHQFQVEFFGELIRNGWRAADEGYHLISTAVTDMQMGVVALQVSDAMDVERIVDATGTQVGEGRARDPQTKTWAVLLQPDASGRWRVADWSEISSEAIEL